MLVGNVLSEEQLTQVNDAAETMLERTGCRIQDAQALEQCRKVGARVDDTGVVRWPRAILRALIAQAPQRYTVTGVDGIPHEIGGGEPFGFAITNDPWVIDYQTRQPRRPLGEDVRRKTIIAQRMELVKAMSCMDFPVSDTSGPHGNLQALQIHLLRHVKHNLVYPTSVESMRRWLRIGEILTRGKELRGSRLFSVGVPSLTPMAVTGMNIELIRIACDYDFPVIPTVCPTAGVTSPYTLAGTLAMGHAEILSLLALTQLYRPGHPFLYAFGPAVGGMADGACLYYTFDKVLWKAASIQLGRALNLPVAAECGGSMVHRFDQQSGAEGMLFMLVAAGADVLAGFGSTHNAVGHSTEMMLIHEAYFRAAQFLRRGIRTDAARLAADAVQNAGPSGEFFTDALTLENLRGDEFFGSDLFDLSGDSALNPSLMERAHAKVETVMADYRSPVPEYMQEALTRFFHDEMAK